MALLTPFLSYIGAGMTLPNCNPRLGYGCTQVFSNYFPEHLGLVICVNHNPMFEGVWRAIKVFLDTRTADKVRLIPSKKKMRQIFDQFFPGELTEWLIEEIARNRKKEFATTQRKFWLPPARPLDHDPRGCPSYVRFYVDNRMTNHKAHPNIEDFEMGRLLSVVDSTEAVHEPVENGVEVDGAVGGTEVNIPDEYQIPVDAKQLG